MSKKHPNPVWRISFNLDTTMWNEGFEAADDPWCTFFTDDQNLLNLLGSGDEAVWRAALPNVNIVQWEGFDLEVLQVIMSEDDEDPSKAVANFCWLQDIKDEEEKEEEADRYLGYLNIPAADVLDIITLRLNKWLGV